ncbi:hypothetical protein [Salipaludibacillus daqingensis]|uniref:hypothetical protein n=1 Tax=Salipaludibacillus daqingensis TaxID=3041001 RepID=UPI002474A890|nr:hypothetical protein [Salipaludibacillus daqingensis]
MCKTLNIQENLIIIYKEIASHSARITSFSEEWLYDPSVENRFQDWVTSVLIKTETIVINEKSNYHQWKLIMLLLIFKELRKELVQRGFYSFYRRSVEQLLSDMIQSFPSNTISSLYRNVTLQKILEQTGQDFSNVTELKTINEPSLKQEADHDKWINDWLSRPHFSKYKRYYHQLTNEHEKIYLKNEVVENLFPLQTHPPTKRTLFQIYDFHEDFKLGINSWLNYPQDPLYLSREEQQLLSSLTEKRPDLAIPLYSQWIERLVEKKTTQHYKKATLFIIELKNTLKKTDNENDFPLFVTLLKKKYKRYAAFYEELRNYE